MRKEFIMNKSKSLFITVIMTVMLAVILYFTYSTESIAFPILVGILGIYGFLCTAAGFCRWCGKETPMLPAETKKDDLWEADEDFKLEYDAIKQEVKEGRL